MNIDASCDGVHSAVEDFDAFCLFRIRFLINELSSIMITPLRFVVRSLSAII